MKKISLFGMIPMILCLILLLPSVPARAASATPVSDAAGLAAIAKDPSGSYVLTDDIDMKGVDWKPISFSGTLDGGGHVIYNLKITQFGSETAISIDGNAKKYETRYAALFSIATGATIRDLTLLNEVVDVRATEGSESNAFASGLIGHSNGCTVENCKVSARVTLYMSGRQCGVAGVIGFGSGSVTGCTADLTLVLVDTNKNQNCEEFLGAIDSCGYCDVVGCTVKLAGYASVHGYCHNGGLIGMDYIYDDNGRKTSLTGNSVDAVIDFFEDNVDRRAYCQPIIGEYMNWNLNVADNTTVNFVNGETKDYSTDLLPEKDANPVYTETVTEATPDSFGYTTYTCKTCGYSYTDNYVKYVPYVPVTSCTLNDADLTLYRGESTQLSAVVSPSDATDPSVVWSSSDEKIAAVDSSGRVTATGRGTAAITCSCPADGVKAVCSITVKFTWQQWFVYIFTFQWLHF